MILSLRCRFRKFCNSWYFRVSFGMYLRKVCNFEEFRCYFEIFESIFGTLVRMFEILVIFWRIFYDSSRYNYLYNFIGHLSLNSDRSDVRCADVGRPSVVRVGSSAVSTEAEWPARSEERALAENILHIEIVTIIIWCDFFFYVIILYLKYIEVIIKYK